MKPKHLQLGQAGEDEAVRYLLKKGMEILERNFKAPFGEIDIIAKEEDMLIFAEVRTKTDPEQGHPLESITSTKKQRIVKTAMAYLKKTAQYDSLSRFDVLAMTPQAKEGWDIEHIESAFEVSQFS